MAEWRWPGARQRVAIDHFPFFFLPFGASSASKRKLKEKERESDRGAFSFRFSKKKRKNEKGKGQVTLQRREAKFKNLLVATDSDSRVFSISLSAQRGLEQREREQKTGNHKVSRADRLGHQDLEALLSRVSPPFQLPGLKPQRRDYEFCLSEIAKFVGDNLFSWPPGREGSSQG